jgi:DNA topoisomerase-3
MCVSSPTLAMLAEREATIAAFVPEPFYTPVIDTGAFTASGERLKTPEDAEAVRAACDGSDANLLSVERQVKTEAPLRLYDLTTLQWGANRRLGYTAQQALDMVQACTKGN